VIAPITGGAIFDALSRESMFSIVDRIGFDLITLLALAAYINVASQEIGSQEFQDAVLGNISAHLPHASLQLRHD
jgi:hypothetical protein